MIHSMVVKDKKEETCQLIDVSLPTERNTSTKMTNSQSIQQWIKQNVKNNDNNNDNSKQ